MRVGNSQSGGSEPALKLVKQILLVSTVLIYDKPEHSIGAGLTHVEYLLVETQNDPARVRQFIQTQRLHGHGAQIDHEHTAQRVLHRRVSEGPRVREIQTEVVLRQNERVGTHQRDALVVFYQLVVPGLKFNLPIFMLTLLSWDWYTSTDCKALSATKRLRSTGS